MAARAIRLTQFVLVRPFTVAASNTVRQGYPVKPSTSYVVECTAIADLCIGVSYTTEDGTWPAGAGDTIGVALLGTNAVVPMRVGTVAVSAVGKFVTIDHTNTDGVRDATIGTGTNACVVYGQALQTGVAGDLIGVNMACGGPTVGA